MALGFFDEDYAEDQTQTRAGLFSVPAKLFGMLVALLSVATFLMFSTYSPEDPSFMNAVDRIPQNALGWLGAYFADPLYRALGRGVWVVPFVLAVWGLRLFLGKNAIKFVGRIVFLPVAVLAFAIFASTHSMPQDWFFVGDSGMGGVFGDSVLRVLIPLTPLPPAGALFVWSFALGFLAIGMLAFVSGAEFVGVVESIRRILRDVRFFVELVWAFLWTFGVRLLTLGAGAGDKLAAIRTQPRGRNPSSNENGEFFEREPSRRPMIFSPNAYDPSLGYDAQDGGFEKVEPMGTLSIGDVLERVSTPERASAHDRARKSAYPMPSRSHAPIEGQMPRSSGLGLSDRIRDIVSKRSDTHRQLLRDALHYQADHHLAPTDMFSDAPQDRAFLEHSEDSQALNFQDFADPDFLVEDNSTQGGLPSFGGVTRGFAPDPWVGSGLVKKTQPSHKISKRAAADAAPYFGFEENNEQFEPPSLSLLHNVEFETRVVLPQEALEASARQLQAVLDDYGVKGEIVAVRPGPVVTMFELEPVAGVKASRVIGLSDDIARSMSALSARVSTVPGRSVIGIEIPNTRRETVFLREILSHRTYGDTKIALPLALGKDISGEPIVVNLAKMPHLLIAGTTGSGKSVAVNTMILSLLYHATPEDVRLIMIDPKMLELSVYDGIPHLLSPVVTDPKKAVVALKWAVSEMEERYRKMAKLNVRNIDGYNARVDSAHSGGDSFMRTVQTGFDDETGEPIFETENYLPEKMPYIVIVVDEMADLMMVAGKEIEACIQRLAQMARASGIHLIMATQRPSVDVITGTIKANFPTRISFQVTSKIDSRTILGEMGAEQLLGQGDMLYMAGGGRITRIHGPFVSDEEVEDVVRHLKAQGEPNYYAAVVDGGDSERVGSVDAILGLGSSSDRDEDRLYDQAVMIVARDRKCSTSYIQRKLAIGYNKAARLVERMEEEGVVSPASQIGRRDVLVPEIS